MRNPGVLRWLYPARCLFCRALLPPDAGERVCAACFDAYVRGGAAVSELDGGLFCVSALRYGGLARQAVLRLKFLRQTALAPPMAELMVRALRRFYGPGDFDCVSWVPVSFWRRLGRGFDQSALLARDAGRALDLPLRPLLRKIRHNRRQSSLPQARRRENVRGVYRLRKNADAAGLRVLLVDDVATSGATLTAAAQVLRQAGAARVTALTFARASGQGVKAGAAAPGKP